MGFQARAEERRDLAAFLRIRRARLQPSDVGLPSGERRRASGLRREEVALLAGIGVAWYTWLEQGRAVQPSARAVDGIARALRLNLAEREHLIRLLEGGDYRRASPKPTRVPKGIQAILDAFGPSPAYVRDIRWDVLAWNAAASRFFGDFGALPRARRNIAWLTLSDPGYRSLLADWDGDARQIVAALRSDYTAAREDPRFLELIREFEGSVPKFGKWWSAHEVRACGSGLRKYNHPLIGRIDLHYVALTMEDPHPWKVVMHAAMSVADSELLKTLL